MDKSNILKNTSTDDSFKLEYFDGKEHIIAVLYPDSCAHISILNEKTNKYDEYGYVNYKNHFNIKNVHDAYLASSREVLEDGTICIAGPTATKKENVKCTK